MRKSNARGKYGKIMRCPKCGYTWKVKNPRKPFICCSRCKRYFKPSKGSYKKKK